VGVHDAVDGGWLRMSEHEKLGPDDPTLYFELHKFTRAEVLVRGELADTSDGREAAEQLRQLVTWLLALVRYQNLEHRHLADWLRRRPEQIDLAAGAVEDTVRLTEWALGIDRAEDDDDTGQAGRRPGAAAGHRDRTRAVRRSWWASLFARRRAGG
jgi:hypothetical protein